MSFAMQQQRARFWSLFLFIASGSLLVLLWTANAAIESRRRADSAQRQRAASRSAAMGNPVGFAGGGPSGSAMLIGDVYAATKWPLLVLTVLGGALSFRFGMASGLLANTASAILVRPAAALACALILAGLVMLLIAGGWHVSNAMKVAPARTIDRQDLRARTQTGVPSPYGGAMSVTFGQPSNEARAAEEKVSTDLPAILLLGAVGLVTTVAGIATMIVDRLRTKKSG
jgi:hypothetical protein